jgi:dephospho-CoA kinase
MIKRDKLADLTFRDNTFRKKLTQGVGKYIFWELLRQLLLGILSAEKYILIDAPLLFETKVLTYLCYPIIVVYLNED